MSPKLRALLLSSTTGGGGGGGSQLTLSADGLVFGGDAVTFA